jgi:hypothetical protein
LVKIFLGDAKPLIINGFIDFMATMHIVNDGLIRLISPNLRQYVIVTSGSESGKVKLFTVTSVILRILGMSTIPPSLKAAVMLLFYWMTSVTWIKAAFEAALVMVGSWIGMVGRIE